MADPIEQAMGELQALLQQTHVASTMQNAAATYDNFAMAAMQTLLRNGKWDDLDKAGTAWLASMSWKIADAMMEERKRRGLGGFGDENGG